MIPTQIAERVSDRTSRTQKKKKKTHRTVNTEKEWTPRSRRVATQMTSWQRSL